MMKIDQVVRIFVAGVLYFVAWTVLTVMFIVLQMDGVNPFQFVLALICGVWTAFSLVKHGIHTIPWVGVSEYDTLYQLLARSFDYEGVVWWSDSTPVAKLKKRDFGLAWRGLSQFWSKRSLDG